MENNYEYEFEEYKKASEFLMWVTENIPVTGEFKITNHKLIFDIPGSVKYSTDGILYVKETKQFLPYEVREDGTVNVYLSKWRERKLNNKHFILLPDNDPAKVIERTSWVDNPGSLRIFILNEYLSRDIDATLYPLKSFLQGNIKEYFNYETNPIKNS